MFNKKQFATVIVSAVIVFAIIFGIFYGVFYKRGIENPIVQPEATVPVVSEVVPTDPAQEVQQIRIGPSTHIFLKMVDRQGVRVAEQKLSVESVLGFTREQLEACFTDYHITTFNKDQVVLEKVVDTPSIEPRYKLALQGEYIGIKSYGEQESFTSLGLSVKDYSRSTQTLLLDEIIELTAAQKVALEQNPNQIEQILQDYSE